MDDSIILGLAGLLSATVIGGLGLYFTARARAAPYRDQLYQKQLAFAEELHRLIHRVQVNSAALHREPGEESRLALEELTTAAEELHALTFSAMAVCPGGIAFAVSDLFFVLRDCLANLTEGKQDLADFYEKLGNQSMKASLLSRELLGVEELSKDSMQLYGDPQQLGRLAEIKADELIRKVQARAENE